MTNSTLLNSVDRLAFVACAVQLCMARTVCVDIRWDAVFNSIQLEGGGTTTAEALAPHRHPVGHSQVNVCQQALVTIIEVT